ncbi:MAG: polysaccharide biosynthesis C-terminal domain-containing protein [Candidatus Thiodiazotropha sp. (ex Dulcina madagascariensis)]|nr:polysaccharide biosynthesis C-terminal domain-containing protein [Candidatus Thiodiazotropha sp. (ex Dulcina madagascariensis)]
MILETKNFFRIFFPMMLSFVSSRLITQTDLIMLSPLGESAVAAYSIPTRVMLFDLIVALALGPVVSVAIAKLTKIEDRRILIKNAISTAMYLGSILMLIGLMVYPYIVASIVGNQHVETLANGAVLYLTLSIPIRLTQFIGAMVLYGSGRGKEITPYILGAVIVNAALNWLFIYYLQFGFEGCYIATILTSIFELYVTLHLLSKDIRVFQIFKLPDIGWIKSVLDKIGSEWGRLVSFQIVNMTMLGLFAINSDWVSRLSAFSIAVDLQAFMLMPLIATMRSVAIALAARPELKSAYYIYRSLSRITLGGLMVVIPVAVIFALFGVSAGRVLYGLSAEAMTWWIPFVFITSLLLPLYFWNALQRGAWQSQGRFSFIFMVEAFTQWALLLPIMYIGLKLGNPWMSWSGILIAEIVIAVMLYSQRRQLSTESQGERVIEECRE